MTHDCITLGLSQLWAPLLGVCMPILSFPTLCDRGWPGSYPTCMGCWAFQQRWAAACVAFAQGQPGQPLTESWNPNTLGAPLMYRTFPLHSKSPCQCKTVLALSTAAGRYPECGTVTESWPSPSLQVDRSQKNAEKDLESPSPASPSLLSL